MTLVELGKYLVSKGLALSFLPAPAAPVVTNQGVAGVTTRSYVLVGKNTLGTTTGSAIGTTATGHAAPDGVNFNRLTWAIVPGASEGYDIYRTVGGATQGLIGSVGPTVKTFDDTGLPATTAVPVANTAAIDIHLGVMGEAPDAIIGLVPGRAWRQSEGQFGSTDLKREYPGVTVIVRGAPYDLAAAELRAHAVNRDLARIQNDVLSNVLYEGVRVSAPFQMPFDKNSRPLVAHLTFITKAPSLS